MEVHEEDINRRNVDQIVSSGPPSTSNGVRLNAYLYDTRNVVDLLLSYPNLEAQQVTGYENTGAEQIKRLDKEMDDMTDQKLLDDTRNVVDLFLSYPNPEAQQVTGYGNTGAENIRRLDKEMGDMTDKPLLDEGRFDQKNFYDQKEEKHK